MFCSDNMRQDDVDINITNTNQNVNMNDNMNYNEVGGMMQNQAPMTMGNIMSPIIEPGRERVINRTFIHEVPQE